MTPEKLLQAQQELKARMAKSQWKLWANAGELQQRRTDAKRRKAKRKWWHTHKSPAACRSAKMKAEREAIDARNAARAEKRKLKDDRRKLRAEARERKHSDPIKEYNRILMLGVEMGRRMQKAEDQETQKP